MYVEPTVIIIMYEAMCLFNTQKKNIHLGLFCAKSVGYETGWDHVLFFIVAGYSTYEFTAMCH
jgi:hypothetical protein